MERVLDTAALLHWPIGQLSGGICAFSQRQELEKLSPSRSLLVETVEIQWMTPTTTMLELARQAASTSGDLPRLSPVDIDVLALALGLQAVLVSDDYRLQNTLKRQGGTVQTVVNAESSSVWSWELRCSGCRDSAEVPPHANTATRGPVQDCPRCGSSMHIKRKRG